MRFTQKKKRGTKKSSRKHQSTGIRKSRAAKPVACVVVLTFLTSVILAIFIAIGCVAPTNFVNQLDLFELHTNNTYDIKLSVGYFGGCLSVDNQTGNEPSTDEQKHCVANMRRKDLDDLSEELWEDLPLSDAAQSQVKISLNATLSQAVRLQREVFPWASVVLQPVLFVISGTMLFVALTASSHKKSYKAVLLLASLLGAFSIALSFVVAVGSGQALNALLDGDDTKTERMISEGIAIKRNSTLRYCQAVGAAATAIFYISIGVLFVRRQPQAAKYV
ncbi:unnamed protein product [Alternaria alternata]